MFFQLLLEFSHDIFEEQSSLTNAIQKILNKALEMFSCKRASLMLLDDPKDIDEVNRAFPGALLQRSNGVMEQLVVCTTVSKALI
jgi:hypothetical protein